MPLVQPTSGFVSKKRDVRPCGSGSRDALDEPREQGISEPAASVLGKHRPVDDVEAPATIADDATHPDADVVIREDPNRCSSTFDRMSEWSVSGLRPTCSRSAT